MANTLPRKWILRVTTLAYMVIIFYLSSMSNIPVPGFFPSWFDKVFHFIEFGLLSLLFYGSMPEGMQDITRYLASILMTCTYGMIDEIHQYFVPGRSMDAFDFLSDCTGAIVFILLIVFYQNAMREGLE